MEFSAFAQLVFRGVDARLILTNVLLSLVTMVAHASIFLKVIDANVPLVIVALIVRKKNQIVKILRAPNEPCVKMSRD